MNMIQKQQTEKVEDQKITSNANRSKKEIKSQNTPHQTNDQ